MQSVHRYLIVISIATVLTLGVIFALNTAYYAIVYMPGSSYQNDPPPLTTKEQHIRDRLERHVRFLAGNIGERNPWKYDNMHNAAEYIDHTFRMSGYNTHSQRVDALNRTFYNIIAEKPVLGDDDAILIIGAHYDTVRGSPGADDNASGVAVLLEVARLLHDLNPHLTVQFVAFANEEAPFYGTKSMGSLAYARRKSRLERNIVGMIALEMVGYYTDAPGSQRYPAPLNLFYPDRGNFIAFVGNQDSGKFIRHMIEAFRRHATIPSEGIAAPEVISDIKRSDHWSFWQQGYPAFMLTDTANFRNPHYHSADDTPETLDYDTMARLTKALALTLADMAPQNAER